MSAFKSLPSFGNYYDFKIPNDNSIFKKYKNRKL